MKFNANEIFNLTGRGENSTASLFAALGASLRRSLPLRKKNLCQDAQKGNGPHDAIAGGLSPFDFILHGFAALLQRSSQTCSLSKPFKYSRFSIITCPFHQFLLMAHSSG